MGGRRRGSKAASASAAGDSRLAGLSAPRVLSCGAVSLVSPVSCAAAAGKGRQAASASEEGKILKLDSLKLDSEETLEGRQPRILMLDSEEDRKILLKVKSEEGKILKLKKEYMEASEKALAGLSSYIDLMPMVKPPAKMKTKKMVVVKTLVPPAYIAFIKAMPCPVTSRVVNLFSEDELAYEPQSFQDYYRLKMSLNMKMRDYHQALVDQYEKFGYAVDEMEMELTDDEDEDEDNAVKN